MAMHKMISVDEAKACCAPMDSVMKGMIHELIEEYARIGASFELETNSVDDHDDSYVKVHAKLSGEKPVEMLYLVNY